MPFSIPAALGLTLLAKDVLGTALPVASKLYNGVSDANKSHSLTAKVRDTYISNSVIIDSALAETDILPGMLNILHSFMVGLVTTAVKLDSHVTGSRTVRDHLTGVQSMEAYRDMADELYEQAVAMEAAVGGIRSATLDHPRSVISQEEIDGRAAYDRLQEGDKLSPEEKRQALRYEKNADKIADRTLSEAERIVKARQETGISVSDGDLKPAENLPFGKVIEITMVNPVTGHKESLPITVRMAPKYAASVTMARLLANYGQGLSIKQRWLMKKAGEINFFRDFIGEGDRADHLAEDLRKDHKGELADLITAAHKKNKFQLLSHLAKAAGGAQRISSNLANSIWIVSEDTMHRAQAEGAGNFDNAKVRQAFFDKSYTLALLVVDTRYDRVKLYINSINDYAEYPFSTFSPKKSFNANDMLKLMSGLAGGRASVF